MQSRELGSLAISPKRPIILVCVQAIFNYFGYSKHHEVMKLNQIICVVFVPIIVERFPKTLNWGNANLVICNAGQTQSCCLSLKKYLTQYHIYMDNRCLHNQYSFDPIGLSFHDNFKWTKNISSIALSVRKKLYSSFELESTFGLSICNSLMSHLGFFIASTYKGKSFSEPCRFSVETNPSHQLQRCAV